MSLHTLNTRSLVQPTNYNLSLTGIQIIKASAPYCAVYMYTVYNLPFTVVTGSLSRPGDQDKLKYDLCSLCSVQSVVLRSLTDLSLHLSRFDL